MKSNFTIRPFLSDYLNYSQCELLEKVAQDIIKSHFEIEGSYFLVLTLSQSLENQLQLRYNDIKNYNFGIGVIKKNNELHLIIEVNQCTYFAYQQSLKLRQTEQSFERTAKLGLVKSLSARELEIAGFVAQGCSNKQVAKQLNISEWTVATHLRRIFMKLQVDNRAAMVYECSELLQKIQAINC